MSSEYQLNQTYLSDYATTDTFTGYSQQLVKLAS